MRSMVVVTLFGGLFLVSALCGPTEASDLAGCANVKDDAERLACYDLLAKEASPQEDHERAAAQIDEAAERERIITRCREDMGEYGSAMVKFCAEEDLAAYKALRRYPAEHNSFVERCMREMGNYGWNMVKFCADEDIDAEQALNDMLAE